MTELERKAPKLLPRERRFIREYLLDFNAAGAIRRAGFVGLRADVAGAKIMARPAVRKALAERQAEINARLEITAERVLKEQAAIAFSDVRKLLNEDGTLKPITELDDAAAASIAEIQVDETFEGSGDERTWSGYSKKVKRWDKSKALEFVARHLGMAKDAVIAPPVGPGLVVMVQQVTNVSSGDATQAAQRVVVSLPGPAAFDGG